MLVTHYVAKVIQDHFLLLEVSADSQHLPTIHPAFYKKRKAHICKLLMKHSLVCYGRMFHKMHLQLKGLGLTRYRYNTNVAVDIGIFLWHTDVLRHHRDRK